MLNNEINYSYELEQYDEKGIMLALRAKANDLMAQYGSVSKTENNALGRYHQHFHTLKAFEANLKRHYLLRFIYPDIAKMALYCHRYREAMDYAKAGLVSNRKHNDHYGIKICTQILIDIAKQLGAPVGAMEQLSRCIELDTAEMRQIIGSIPSRHEKQFSQWMKINRPPKSLRACLEQIKARQDNKHNKHASLYERGANGMLYHRAESSLNSH